LAQHALGADDNDITLFDARGEHALGRASKLELARRLVAHVASMLAGEKRARAKA
jgi:phosphopantothenoylcysteine decarboxylase/phosphopantothenate--cysteine ligase